MNNIILRFIREGESKSVFKDDKTILNIHPDKYIECSFEYINKDVCRMFQIKNQVFLEGYHINKYVVFELVSAKHRLSGEKISFDTIYNYWRILNE
jgi:hypothetical protein